MLKVIDEQDLIRKYARQFVKNFKPFIEDAIKVKLGHQGASFRAKVSWSRKLGIWVFSQATKDVRYWNVFGIGKPQTGSHLPITAEINFPWSGIDRKTGAAFARDAWNRIYVIHRGKIGGGKKGIGKSLFEENYRGVWAWLEDGGALTQVAVIGELHSSRFALQTAQFVRKIGRLKSEASLSSQTLLNFSEVSFHEERVGNLPVPHLEDDVYSCDQDLIVTHLAALLERWKFKVGNDADYGLFLMPPDGDKVSHVLAVASGSREESVYSTAAKLLLRQSAASGHPSAILLIPEEKMNIFTEPLRRINIDVLGYRLEGEKIAFPDLGKIKPDQDSPGI